MRNSKVRTRKAADPGTGTFDVITFMDTALENAKVGVTDPDDLNAAAEVTKSKCENIGLVYGRLWEEHAIGWIVGIFARFAIYGKTMPKPVVDPRPTRTKVPGAFEGALGGTGDDPDTGGDPDVGGEDEEESEFGTQQEPPKITGAAAQKYFTHVKKGSAQVLFYMTHAEIAANVSVRRNTLAGKTHIFDEWERLLEGVPEGKAVWECFTPEQLETFDLRGDFPAEDV